MRTTGATVTILDGGMGKELRRIGAPFRQPEWSALALMEDPGAVARAHRNFIEAGAEVIITNAYAVVPFHLGEERFAERGWELASLAGELAAKEAGAALRQVEVAGSLPPVFGSYEPDAFDPELAPGRWQVLIDAQADHVDLWVGETIAGVAEFDCLERTLTARRPDRRLWAAFTVADLPVGGATVLRSGESIEAVADAVVDRNLEAVLINCSQPERIADALIRLAPAARAGGFRLGAYANAFPAAEIDESGYAANERIIERRDDLTPTLYADFVAGWIDAGATIVGGCCDIYPSHIAELARRFGS